MKAQVGNILRPRLTDFQKEDLTLMVKKFVLNGYFREMKVMFAMKEMDYGSRVYQRVALHFSSGLADENERIDLNHYDTGDVIEWWNKKGKKMLHKKMMEKKSNAMGEIRKLMRCKWARSVR